MGENSGGGGIGAFGVVVVGVLVGAAGFALGMSSRELVDGNDREDFDEHRARVLREVYERGYREGFDARRIEVGVAETSGYHKGVARGHEQSGADATAALRRGWQLGLKHARSEQRARDQAGRFTRIDGTRG